MAIDLKFYTPRAFVRRLAMLHTIFYMGVMLPVFKVLEWMHPEKVHALPTWLIMLNILPAVLVSLDVAVVLYYAHKIQPENPGAALIEAFVYGTTWSSLRELYTQKFRAVEEILRQAEAYPSLLNDPGFRELLAMSRVMQANVMLQRAKKVATWEERTREDQRLQALRKQSRGDNARKELLTLAARAGIEATEAISLIDRSHVHARLHFEARLRQQQLAARVEAAGCTLLVGDSIAGGREEWVEALLNMVSHLMTKADALGLRPAFQELVSKGQLEEGRALLLSAERDRRYDQYILETSQRISRLSAVNRTELAPQLAKLEDLRSEFEKRPWRLAAHSLTRKIDEAESKPRARAH